MNNESTKLNPINNSWNQILPLSLAALTAGWNNAEWLQICIICIVAVYALSINLAHLLKSNHHHLIAALHSKCLFLKNNVSQMSFLKWDNVQDMSASLLRLDLGVKWSCKCKMAQMVIERHCVPSLALHQHEEI